jgi:DNA mismatch repair protein MutS
MSGTGIVEEFRSLKRASDADLLTMQCGDFFEFFEADAEAVGELLGLKVSMRSGGGSEYPMAGVPVAQIDEYLSQLVARGQRVAVAEQFTDESGGHYRQITRTATPGTLLDAAERRTRPVGVLTARDGQYGVAIVDVVEGTAGVATVADPTAAGGHLRQQQIGELLVGPTVAAADATAVCPADAICLEDQPAVAFEVHRGRQRLAERFGEAITETRSIDDPAAVAAVGAAIWYIEAMDPELLRAVTRLRVLGRGDRMQLDATTARNLELFETMYGEREGSLLATLDGCVTGGGRRLLRRWIGQPSCALSVIETRQAEVTDLIEVPLVRNRLRDTLAQTYDLGNLAARLASGRITPADVGRLRHTLARLPTIDELLRTGTLADGIVAEVTAAVPMDRLESVHAQLEAALVADPPRTTQEGGIFARGYDAELDAILAELGEVESWVEHLAEQEQAETGLRHLSTGRNQTDGLYIQVGRSETDGVPDRYEEVKTLKSAKRYRTAEIAEQERALMRLEADRTHREESLYAELLEALRPTVPAIQEAAAAIARVDVVATAARHAAKHDWVRPVVHAEWGLEIEGGRHPVVEQTTRFVPNDTRFDHAQRCILVTGPNMGGKSTYMRQTALIVLLAQMGWYVPATAATMGIVDGIFTRVGALDELAEGRSTFMIEMAELANILHQATDRSLVVLDEVGRGTATYDGVAIAWATMEHLSAEVEGTPTPAVLFATHYHELTEVADRMDGVANVHVEVEDDGEEVAFLRTVAPGPADRSYGVHVAEIAGVPAPVVDRASTILSQLRDETAIQVGGGQDPGTQVVFDVGGGTLREADNGTERDPQEEALRDAIAALDVASMTPGELVVAVEQIQQRFVEPDG